MVNNDVDITPRNLNGLLYQAQAEVVPKSFVLANAITAAQTTNQPVVNPGGRTIHTVQVSGTATSISAQIEGSLDNEIWSPIGSAITAVGFTTFEGTYSAIRLTVNTLSGGNLTAMIRSQRK